jgi:hypothetical protein
MKQVPAPKYLLEYGHSWYEGFNTMEQVDEFRINTGYDGILYTYHGHLVNEDKARELENLERSQR